ncbi:MAG: ABC transporter ATP-binding protein [Candidatus Gorgyraea atricola]|nr:ABC transporter ATP-binding protein [Candidatus Gorgyraea atricola]
MKYKQLKTIAFFLKNYKSYIFGILICSALYAIFEGLNIAVLFPIINSVIKDGMATGEGSKIIQFLNLLISVVPAKDTFISACIIVVAIVILKNIFRYLYMGLNAFASYKIWDDVQKRLFYNYINADYRYFLGHKQGEIVYRVFSAPSELGSVLKLIPQLATEILKIFFIIMILFSMSFPVSCAVVIIGGIFYFFTRNISRKISYSIGIGRVKATEEQSILLNEMINGIKQIKLFLGERRWISGFHGAMNKYFKLAKKDTLWINMPVSALEIFAISALGISLIIVKEFSPQSLVSNLPLLGVFAYAFQRVMPSLSLITSMKMQIMGSLAVFETLYSVSNEKMTYLEDGTRCMSSFNEKIEFRSVSFSYPDRSEVLKDISVSFDKNRCIAIVGQSGSGKTTIVNLLARLFDPTKGAILVDGVDLREYKKTTWLSRIGFVSQDTFIFHASVKENIIFGFEGAKEEDVIKSAMISNAHDFIMKLPDGYDTVVGEKGMKLSGGEQQRLSIARAILRNPQILIFDEATSALDNMSQSLIQGSINKIVKDHTVILIAHRLSTIVNADKIVVLDNGIVKEEGNHSELINKRGYYSKLYKREDDCIPAT